MVLRQAATKELEKKVVKEMEKTVVVVAVPGLSLLEQWWVEEEWRKLKEMSNKSPAQPREVRAQHTLETRHVVKRRI